MSSYNYIVYDIESFPNFFSFCAYDSIQDKMLEFEVSWRKNDIGLLMQWLDYWKTNDYYMVGYNNIGYDYPMIHEIMTGHGYVTAQAIYTINERIINTPWEQRFTTPIRPYDVLIKQIDLFKIHHFDNDARRTSLKKLEFVMRARNISESKYKFGAPLPETDIAATETLSYNKDDITNTLEFFTHTKSAIDFRFAMGEKYNKNFLNHNDTKIGKDYFIMELQKAGVHCYDNSRRVIQTYREHIDLKDCVPNYVSFERPEFKAILSQINSTRIYETKGSLKMSAILDNFQFDFGLGGIHGSVKGCKFVSDDEYLVIDADVTSYYPSLAIKNNLFPEHLSTRFCEVYEDVFNQRKSYKKGTPENAAMKLALNGVYGDSNSVYSPFYDPKFTMSITISGQLLLCMLAEQLMKIPGLQMIQINTDGLTVNLPRKYRSHYDNVCQWWQDLTQLNLEYAEYERMIIRDVNNYIAVPFDGKPKFKGAYVHSGAHEKGELGWHQNHSALVVKKATSAAVLDNVPLSKFIRGHNNIYDFCKLANVGKKDGLHLHDDVMFGDSVLFKNHIVGEVQKTTRYIVTKSGPWLIKSMPPLKRRTKKVNMVYPGWVSKKDTGFNKNLVVENEAEYVNAVTMGYVTKDGGTYSIGPVRKFQVEGQSLTHHKGRSVQVVNNMISENIEDYDIDYDYYINEAEKLVHAMDGTNYD